LLQAIRYGDDHLKMPPKEKLPESVIADFEKWIAMGAPDPRDGDGKAAAKPVFLPIAGHEVDVALDAGGWYEIAAGDESAWVFASQKLYAGVTDTTGVVVLRDVPAGTYTVTGWFPPYAHGHPYGGQKQVTVTAGALAEVTVDLGPWAGTSP